MDEAAQKTQHKKEKFHLENILSPSYGDVTSW